MTTPHTSTSAVCNAMPVASFNDDDVYIYKAATKELVRSISCKDSQVRDCRYIGLRVMAGESWAKGMAAKSLGLWSKKESLDAGYYVKPASAAVKQLAGGFAGALEG